MIGNEFSISYFLLKSYKYYTLISFCNIWHRKVNKPRKMFKTILFLCFVGFSLGSLLGGWRDYHGKVPESVIAVVKQKYRVEHNIQVTKIKIHNVKTQV